MSGPQERADPAGPHADASRDGRPKRGARRATRRGTGRGAQLEPGQTSDDTDTGWGERPDEDAHDRWLREQRPPHWE